MSEKVYTLAQAKQVLAEAECAYRGHSYDVIESFGVGPTKVICRGCGRSWAIA